MPCDISKGRALLECKDSVAGIKAVYMANYDDYAYVTSSGASGGNLITDLGSLTEVFKFELKGTGNTFTQDITSSTDNGTTFFNQVLNFVLIKTSAETEFQIKMMAWGRPQIFVESNAGNVFLMGIEHGCDVTGKSEIQGPMGGLNGYTLTATAMERESVYYLDSASKTALLALVSSNNL